MNNLGLPIDEVPQSGVAVAHADSCRLKAELAKLLTCTICKRIFKDATTINLCMHTFCRECILQKLQKDRVTSCPTCNVDLSHLAPEHYLRADEAWRNLVNGYLDIGPK